MADFLTPAERSRRMGLIRGKNTKPELLVREYLKEARVVGEVLGNVGHLPGCPDVVLPDLGVAVRVHGCFWHGHRGCARAGRPPEGFWAEKIRRNKVRDLLDGSMLRCLGWAVVDVWECEVSSPRRAELRGLPLLLARVLSA